jgi:hypothetical protein
VALWHERKKKVCWPLGIMVKVKKKFIDSKYPRTYINNFFAINKFLDIFWILCHNRKNKQLMATKDEG